MATVGSGVIEIRLTVENEYRIFTVAKFEKGNARSSVESSGSVDPLYDTFLRLAISV